MPNEMGDKQFEAEVIAMIEAGVIKGYNRGIADAVKVCEARKAGAPVSSDDPLTNKYLEGRANAIGLCVHDIQSLAKKGEKP